MKIFFRILLVIAIAAMSYLCVMSIVTPIEFEKTQTFREKAIISHLIQIRKAQVEYKNQFDHFTASGDTLIDFIKNGQVPVVLKEGTLTDEQLKNGLTEEKAMKIINKGNKKEIEANGLVGFRRDTSYVSVYESLFADEFPKEEIENIMTVPYSNGKKFEMETANYTNATSGITVSIFEARAPYDFYLSDLNRQELINLKDKSEKLGKYSGLKVGSIEEPNNNAGNWE